MTHTNPIDGQSSRWQGHDVRRINRARYDFLDAERQVVTDGWARVVGMPYIVYMPERDRVLMVVYLDYGPCKPATLCSDDHGSTWSGARLVDTAVKRNPGFGDTPTCLTYLGGGTVMFSGVEKRWVSRDFGETWEGIPIPAGANGKEWAGWQWDPYLVDRDEKTGAVKRLVETAYSHEGAEYPKQGYFSQAYLRSSTDEGATWNTEIAVPQWRGINEVSLCRAANGDIIACCRTDISAWFRDPGHRLPGHEPPDLYSGFGISISKDDGMTWSEVKIVYDHGRHFASFVVLPDSRILMTYMVRIGYPVNVDGFPQYGIEAMLSDDHGATWDVEHRLILDAWTGNQRDENAWWASPQSTSSVLLPDGRVLTAYGRAYRCTPTADGKIGPPRDIGLVRWRV